VKFIADGMLGKLTRWLRLLGYDVKYLKDCQDPKLIEIAKNEKRILLTKDLELYKRSKILNIQAVLLRGSCLEEDLAQLAKSGYIKLEVNFQSTRCPLCNAPLKIVNRTEVKNNIPAKILQSHDKFWICSNCGKIYWIGSHWNSISLKLLKAKQLNRGM